MDEHPANAVRRSELLVVTSCALVADGRARAVVSAGNSGAMIAAALFTIKRIPGIARPAIGASFPSDAGQTFILDVGANTDRKPEWLAQFAVMGDVYARTMLGVATPRVAPAQQRRGGREGHGARAGERIRCSPRCRSLRRQRRGQGHLQRRRDVVVDRRLHRQRALKTAEGVGEFLFAEHQPRGARPLAASSAARCSSRSCAPCAIASTIARRRRAAARRRRGGGDRPRPLRRRGDVERDPGCRPRRRPGRQRRDRGRGANPGGGRRQP